MNEDILIIRDGEGYRVLFGHLRLTSVLSLKNEAFVNAHGDGVVKIVKTSKGLLVSKGSQELPLYRN